MEPSLQEWQWEQLGRKCAENLKKNGFDAFWVPDLETARNQILPITARHNTFGFGGSDTVRQLGLIEHLKLQGKTVFDHWQRELSPQESMALRRAQLHSDCFFCSANAISLDGQIVNVDGAGNRTSAMGFGPAQVIIVAGMNKVASDLPGALRRVREVAGPLRAKSLNMKTPCAETGICSDCHAPQRICRITTILHRQPVLTPISVFLINQALGY